MKERQSSQCSQKTTALWTAPYFWLRISVVTHLSDFAGRHENKYHFKFSINFLVFLIAKQRCIWQGSVPQYRFCGRMLPLFLQPFRSDRSLVDEEFNAT